MRKVFAVAAALSIGSPAMAQVNWGLGQQQFNANQAIDAYRQGQQMRAMREQMARDAQAQQLWEESQKRRVQVGSLLKAGDCKGARDYALAQGDLELATQATAICQQLSLAPAP